MISNVQVEEFRKTETVRRAVRTYSSVNALRQSLTLFFDWSVVVAVAAISSYSSHWAIYLLSILVIAGRQHALLVMMHEGAHYRLSPSKKVNDWIADFLAAYPLLFSTMAYRKNHLAHHKYTNTSEDPDWVRKASNPEWSYPQSKVRIFAVLFKQLLTAPRDWLMLALAVSRDNIVQRSVYWGVMLTGFYAMGLGQELLLYWMVPLFTMYPVFQRYRSISEHFGLARTHEFNETRNTIANPLETMFFAPHNVNYHLAHHLFPSVPQYNLAALHREFMQVPIYRDYAHNSYGFFVGKNSVLGDLSKVPEEAKARKAA